MATKNVTVNVDPGAGADMKAVAVLEGGEMASVDERVPMAEPEGGWPADEWTGKGGSYVRDPYTGIRTPTAETAAALAAAAAAQ